MKRLWRPQLTASLFMLALLLILTAATFAAAAGKIPVRVGFVPEPLYNYVDADGKHHGYAHEIIYNIAMRAGLAPEYVSFTNYEDEDEALKAGSIDLEITVPKSAQREREFLFSEVPTGRVAYAIIIRDDDDRYSYGDTAAINLMKIAGAKNDASVEAFVEWCRNNKLHPVIEYYPTVEAAIAAVKTGKADGCINYNTTQAGFHSLLSFSTLPFYVMMNKNSWDLASRVNTALRNILTEEPLYEETLHREYLSPKSGNMGVLTRREKKFLADHPTLIVAVRRYDPPYSDTGSGAASGVIPDYYRYLSASLGVGCRFVGYDSESEIRAAVLQGKADIAGLYGGDVCSACRDGLALVTISSPADMVVLSHGGDGGVARAAVLTSNKELIADKLASQANSRSRLQDYSNIELCYKAFKAGRADCIICTSPSAVWLLNNRRLTGCVMLPFMSMRCRLCSAVADARGPLYAILSKSMFTSYGHMQDAINANTMPQSDLHSVLDRIPATMLAAFAAALLVMVISLSFLLMIFSRRHRERAALAVKQAENEIARVKLESLEKSGEERDMFFSNISHDMRTPLNGIVGFTQLALASGDLEQVHDYLRKIAVSGKLLVDLIDDTLTISKLNSGKLEPRFAPVDAQKLAEEVVTPVRETAAAKGIAFSADTSQLNGKVILADGLNVKKILLNLLSNAVKYTPEGGRIEFLVRDSSKTPDHMEFTAVVRDNGIGIAPGFLPRLCEPFTQEGRAANSMAGTGLGMYIVKRLTDLMEGEIKVKSELGKGSEFTLRLSFPLVKGFVSEDAPAADDAVESDILRGRKVLLCEDNQLNREIAQAVLQSRELSVITAADGRLGVEAFAASRPGEISVVLMDIRMPNMDGFAASRAIRAMARPDCNVPIIALTANAYEEDIRECLAAGMDSHVAKPLDAARLLSEIARLCSSARPPQNS